MLLVDLAHYPPYQRFLSTRTKLSTCLSIPLILLGWYLISYPDDHADWSSWSLTLYNISPYIFPSGVTNLSKRYTALGVDIVAFGIQACHPAKHVLSNRFFLWLGKNSFAVYLIHGTLLRTVLAWMLYGITGQPFDTTMTTFVNEETGESWEVPIGPWLPRRAHGVLFWIIIGIWLAIVYFCAQMWTDYVDAWCGRITKKLEEHVFLAEGEKEDDGVEDEKSTTLPSSAAAGPLLG